VLCDYDLPRLRQRLQSRGYIGRVANHPPLLRFPFTDEIANDHQSSRDPHSNLEGCNMGNLQLWNCFDQRQPAQYRPFCVILVRVRVAEICKYPIAHVLRDEPASLGDLLGAAEVIGADDLAHVFGVEADGERRRADKVAEHDCELAAFGACFRGWRGSGRGGDRRRPD
jgi:hypothetical protein